jgi:cytosine/uracil/thiamine/allantoin permease
MEMQDDSRPLTKELQDSPLYSEDLAPVPISGRIWRRWNLAALWVGMAVCIPTYLLASYMIRSGLNWYESLIIIGLANLFITLPMVLNGQPGVLYGIPFPVQGRAAFGTRGVHLPAILRGFVACGWFGIQTWIGGLAIYSIWNALTGSTPAEGLTTGKFVAFAVFWFVNIYFIWRGTQSIKWLEDYSAPILIVIGIVLVAWGYRQSGSFSTVLEQSGRLGTPTLIREGNRLLIRPLADDETAVRATEYSLNRKGDTTVVWKAVVGETILDSAGFPDDRWTIRFRAPDGQGGFNLSSFLEVPSGRQDPVSPWWNYLIWFTSMVGFWATMSISISDITRFSRSQRDQVQGQFIGLPGTMMFYSFIGIFVTSAAVISFRDILVSEDAPWDPVTLMDRFKSPWVVVFAQSAMIIATLSTNIAANVIAPAYAISNLFPKKIDFKTGGVIAGLVGILLCPWWLMDDISGILIFISGLLGPVLAVLLCDFFVIRKKMLDVPGLYSVDGPYRYRNGFRPEALIAFVFGAAAGLAGKWIPGLEPLYRISWFTAFFVAFVFYYLMARAKRTGR